MYDTDADSLVRPDWAPTGVAVEYGNGAMNPIDFADEHGELNDELPPMGHLRAAADPSVVFFVAPGIERDVPEYDPEGALRVLDFWGSEGYIPEKTADAIAEAFGVSLPDDYGRDDDDADGVRIVRAPRVVARIASHVLGEVESSDATGHKKRRRVKFHRNLDNLNDAVGVSDE